MTRNIFKPHALIITLVATLLSLTFLCLPASAKVSLEHSYSWYRLDSGNDGGEIVIYNRSESDGIELNTHSEAIELDNSVSAWWSFYKCTVLTGDITAWCPFDPNVSIETGSGDDSIRLSKYYDGSEDVDIVAELGAGDDVFDTNDYHISDRDDVDLGAGNDVVYTGDGRDRIRAVDGEADEIRCGDGDDVVYADLIDSVHSSCDEVIRH